MNKRAITPIIITVCLILLVAFYAYRFYQSQWYYVESLYDDIFVGDPHTTPPGPNPNVFSDYPEGKTGGYQFDPRTIFESLDQGQNVFIPDEPNAVDVRYDGIAWTQSDFLRVADALSEKVWHEPLDLSNWHVYDIFFEGSCHNNLAGLNTFEITYYKTIKTGWETVYTARHITLYASQGGAAWAGDGNFSSPFIFGWTNLKLPQFKTSADQAVQIAEQNGAKPAQGNSAQQCNIEAYIAADPDRDYEDVWYVAVDYYNERPRFSVFVDPFTGDVYQIAR